MRSARPPGAAIAQASRARRRSTDTPWTTDTPWMQTPARAAQRFAPSPALGASRPGAAADDAAAPELPARVSHGGRGIPGKGTPMHERNPHARRPIEP